MSFIEKIKGFFKQSPAESEIQEEIIKLNELPNKIKSLTESNGLNNLELKNKIKERISQFSRDIRENIEILEKIDLEKRKEIESIKSRVLQNLNVYLFYLNNLAKDLDNLKEPDPVAYFNKTIIILDYFYKASYLPYEKATYLIGKEMASAKNSVKKFTQDIRNLSEGNKDLFEKTKKISHVSNLFEQIKQSEKLEQNIQKEINDFNLKISNMNKEYNKVEEKIKAIKESENYKKDLQEKKDYLNRQAEIDRELEKIKKEIDYKILANMFHNDDKKFKIIKSYSEDFKSAFITEEEPKIIGLVKEAQNLDISYIKELKQNLMELSPPILETETEILNLGNRLESIEYEKKAAKLNVHEKNKRQNKLTDKKEKTVSDLKNILTELGVTLEN